MRALRIVGRGLKDTYEQLFGFVLASVGWWLSAVLIVTLPAGTLALFMVTDPRRAIDRPDIREVLTYLRASIGKGWILALVTLPIPLVLFLNLYSFAGTDNWLAVLTPLWAVLLAVGLIVTFLSFSTMSLLSGGLSLSLKRADTLPPPPRSGRCSSFSSSSSSRRSATSLSCLPFCWPRRSSARSSTALSWMPSISR